MEHYAGIDASLERSSICVVGAGGQIVRDARVASEPQSPKCPNQQEEGWPRFQYRILHHLAYGI
jgi:hypothetical protein